MCNYQLFVIFPFGPFGFRLKGKEKYNMDITQMEQITPIQLYELMLKNHNVLMLDVRNEDEYEAWKIEGKFTPDTVNIPYFEFFENEDEAFSRVERDRPIVVVCAKGGASDFVALRLGEEGIKAANLSEGMIGWGNLYIHRVIVQTPEFEIYQIDRTARGCLSYVLISDGKAAIIDPLRHTEKYTDFLELKEASLALILDTHGHADHISGAPALSELTGAPYYLHPYDGIHPFDLLPAKLVYRMLHDGMKFSLGDLLIETVHVPGHTLGQVNFLVKAPSGRSFVFTGDNLFIQSFGRPDLGGQGQSWAPLVYNTIFNTVVERIPSDALVLPGHFAKHDEANEDGTYSKPLSALWKENEDLSRLNEKETFINFVLAHLPDMPEQYIQIKRINAGLAAPDEDEASELELGKNICALSTAYE